MGKRTASEAESKSSQNDRHPKRQRIQNSAERNSPRLGNSAEEVTTARQLQKTLLFEQGTASSFRSGTFIPNLFTALAHLARPQSPEEIP